MSYPRDFYIINDCDWPFHIKHFGTSRVGLQVQLHFSNTRTVSQFIIIWQNIGLIIGYTGNVYPKFPVFGQKLLESQILE